MALQPSACTAATCGAVSPLHAHVCPLLSSRISSALFKLVPSLGSWQPFCPSLPLSGHSCPSPVPCSGLPLSPGLYERVTPPLGDQLGQFELRSPVLRLGHPLGPSVLRDELGPLSGDGGSRCCPWLADCVPKHPRHTGRLHHNTFPASM